MRYRSTVGCSFGEMRGWPRALASNVTFRGQPVHGRGSHIRANIRAHRDMQSEHDARRYRDSRDVGESGLLQEELGRTNATAEVGGFA
jgi:hypothetical protein